MAVGRRAENEITDLPDFLFEIRPFGVESFFNFEGLNSGFFGGVKAKGDLSEFKALAFDFDAGFGKFRVLVGHLEECAFEIKRLAAVKSARELIEQLRARLGAGEAISGICERFVGGHDEPSSDERISVVGKGGITFGSEAFVIEATEGGEMNF